MMQYVRDPDDSGLLRQEQLTMRVLVFIRIGVVAHSCGLPPTVMRSGHIRGESARSPMIS